MKKQNRLKSKVTWMAVAAQVIIIVTTFLPDIAQEVKVVINAVLEILTVVGILNNPTDKENF